MIIFSYLLYYLVIIPISLLPFPVLYAVSDGLYVLLFHVIGYRKKVVFSNLRHSFPGKTETEIEIIAKKFYHHLCDLIVESLKIFTISKSDVDKRVICINPEVCNKFYGEGRSVIFAGGHYNNWELFAVAIDDAIKHQAVGIYLPLTNKFFDEKMRATRGKYGLKMISTKKIKELFETNQSELSATIFAIDQSPGNPKNCYWMKFLNQETGVLFGAEKYAKQYNYPVLFGRINKVKRGHYTFELVEISDQPSSTAYGYITEKVTHMIEADIVKQPEYWLWTHKRWKHKKPTE